MTKVIFLIFGHDFGQCSVIFIVVVDYLVLKFSIG